MSLKLREALQGRPNELSSQPFDAITVAGTVQIIYASLSNVVVLNQEARLKETLLFWSAFPHRASSSAGHRVTGVKCCSQASLLFAWSGSYLAVWKFETARDRGWALHTTLQLSDSVTTVDFVRGTLAVGTSAGLELWRMDSEGDVAVWDRLWQRRSYPSPLTVQLSPSLGHLAWLVAGHNKVYLLGLDRSQKPVNVPQELRHPREIQRISWRNPKSETGDPYLYTVTINSVLRIYSPVLDDPTWFQLLSTLGPDAFSSSLKPLARADGQKRGHAFGFVLPLESSIVHEHLDRLQNDGQHISSDVSKIIKSMREEECDIVTWLSPDGRLVLRSIVNTDRKPPTLLRSLPLSQIEVPLATRSALHTLGGAKLSFSPKAGLIVVTLCDSQIRSFAWTISDLLSGSEQGMRAVSNFTLERTQLSNKIEGFARTPNGRGLLAVCENGESAVWYKQKIGKSSKERAESEALLGRGHWNDQSTYLQTALYAKGRAIVTYERGSDEATVHLRHLDRGRSTPTAPINLPEFDLPLGDDLELLLAVSDVDDGNAATRRKAQRAFIVAASKQGRAWVWEVVSPADISGFAVDDIPADPPSVRLFSSYRLPIEHSARHKHASPALVLPVDPMGWHQSVIDWETNSTRQDMILTISSDGCLEFWTPHLHEHSLQESSPHVIHGAQHQQAWIRSGIVRTGKTEFHMARCSARKKTVLVCSAPGGKQEVTIWDSVVSEFSTGLEWTQEFDEPIQDLDWTTTSDLQSVLAIGHKHKVVLVCEQRLSYVDSTPGWAPFITIDMMRYDPTPISDSIWLAGGSLAVGAGNQIYLFSRFLDRQTPTPSPHASARSLSMEPEEPEDIFQLIAHRNGPLWDCHPVVLAQCLLWNKIELVKTILTSLQEDLKETEIRGRRRLKITRLDPTSFYSTIKQRKASKKTENRYDGLFTFAPSVEEISEEDDPFNSRLVQSLVDYLDGPIRMPLDDAEKSMLATVAQATLEVEELRRSLDSCGLRYLLSIRMIVNHNRRSGMSGAATPASMSSGRGQARLSFRNMVWAMHSESQDVLLNGATNCCSNGKMLWPEAKNLGVFLWLRSNETLKAQLEVLARNRFMADDDRDPTACSLIFFALGKKKVVHGLWRQAPGHKEQNVMLKFLANDFELERWKTAAVKNAYALLSKQRYEYAAAFFMLAGHAKDAINICLRQLDDWQLAYALARVVEGGTDGPIVRTVLTDTVIPQAFNGGHRWLATWAFWILGRRDLAVQVLISPMEDVAAEWSPIRPIQVGNPENDDPSLLLLFQHLKSKSLQTAKGTNDIPEKVEFDFVLHNARVFFRMGCHSLALDLLRSWSFERPFFPQKRTTVKPPAATPVPSTPTPIPTPSLTRPSPSRLASRRPSFMLSAHGRHESMIMDMDPLVESEPVTRVPSPTTNGHTVSSISNGDPEPRASDVVENESKPTAEPPRKMGNLMKELKQDVQQGAAEFDMNAFF